jgi:7-cyano-7-deazaguanine synthase in queuosine biosynthesis
MEEFELGGKYLQRDRSFSRNRKCTVLSNLSGGIDSVYGTYKLLLEGERVLIHHCHLTSRKRMRYETIATARVLDWFREQGLDNFEYIDSAVVLPPAPHLKRMRDPEIIMALTGTILRARRHLKRVAYWNIIGDTSTEDPEGEATVARVEMMYICARRRNIEIERPLQEMTKSEVIRAMPRELFLLCFWCRSPQEDGTPCRTCKTCLSVYEDAELIDELTVEDDE